VIEVINVDLGLIHVAAPSRGVPGTILNSTGALFRNTAPAGCHRLTSVAVSPDRLIPATLITIFAASCRAARIVFAAPIMPGSAPVAPVDRPGLGTGRDLALLGSEGGQHLLLLALRHPEVIQGVGQLPRHFVEHLQ